LAVDFGDFQVAQKFVDTVSYDRKFREKEAFPAAERSGWICKTEQFFLRLPAEREIAAAGGEKLRGEFRGLAVLDNSFNDSRREKGQVNHATDVALADALALADFNH
jgi:hypothetical protein